MKTIQTTCDECGLVQLPAASVWIDDENETYDFFCPVCEGSVQKRMDDKIRGMLRSANVPTLDERVKAEAVVLEDNRLIWKAMLS